MESLSSSVSSLRVLAAVGVVVGRRCWRPIRGRPVEQESRSSSMESLSSSVSSELSWQPSESWSDVALEVQFISPAEQLS